MGRLVLFLSPHLDDAVLSCPSYIQRLPGVHVATIFTEGPGYHARRAEDRKAAARLGASVTHLCVLGAPFRSPRYRDFCGIVFGRTREYAATRRQVTQEISRLISQYRPEQVVAPLAVGNHIDHRIVRDAALAAVPLDALLFYEDRPYSFVREKVGHVLGRHARSWTRYFAATYVRRYRGRTTGQRIIRCWTSVPPFPPEYCLRKAFTIEIRGAESEIALSALHTYRSRCLTCSPVRRK